MILEKIVEMCKKNNTNISRVERELGLGKGTIRHWNTNQPTAANLVLVADYFGLSTDYLLKDKPELDTKKNIEILKLISDFSKEQIDLLKCYITILKQTI